uniref:Uncharacterized protein n=1 Tax=Pyrodinium bahamense TaxID=73915 RepID=A0A7R9ZY92_9DINO
MEGSNPGWGKEAQQLGPMGGGCVNQMPIRYSKQNVQLPPICRSWGDTTWMERPPAGTPAPGIVGMPVLLKAVTKGDIQLAEARKELRKQRELGKWWCPRYDQCGPCCAWCCSLPACCFWLVVMALATCGLVMVALNHGFSGGFNINVSGIFIRELPEVDKTTQKGRLDLDVNFTFTNSALNDISIPRVFGDVSYRDYDIGTFKMDGGPLPSKSTSKRTLHVLSSYVEAMPAATRMGIGTLLFKDWISNTPLPLEVDLLVTEGYITFKRWNVTVPFSTGAVCTIGVSIENYKSLLECDRRDCKDLQEAWRKAVEEGMKTRQEEGEQLCSGVHLRGWLPFTIGLGMMTFLASICCVLCIPLYRCTHRAPRADIDEERLSLPRASQKE